MPTVTFHSLIICPTQLLSTHSSDAQHSYFPLTHQMPNTVTFHSLRCPTVTFHSLIRCPTQLLSTHEPHSYFPHQGITHIGMIEQYKVTQIRWVTWPRKVHTVRQHKWENLLPYNKLRYAMLCSHGWDKHNENSPKVNEFPKWWVFLLILQHHCVGMSNVFSWVKKLLATIRSPTRVSHRPGKTFISCKAKTKYFFVPSRFFIKKIS